MIMTFYNGSTESIVVLVVGVISDEYHYGGAIHDESCTLVILLL